MAIRHGQPVPDRIMNAPELTPGLELYLSAFFDLDSERSHGNGPMPIPWSSIKSYAAAFDFDEEQTEDLFYFTKALDDLQMKRVSEKMKAK